MAQFHNFHTYKLIETISDLFWREWGLDSLIVAREEEKLGEGDKEVVSSSYYTYFA